MTRQCMLCSPTDCEPHFLYVVRNQRDGSFKIGCTKNVTRRLGHYRANGNAFFHMEFSCFAGCKWKAWKREETALRSLAKVAKHKSGDWYFGDIDDAVECVARACKGVTQ